MIKKLKLKLPELIFFIKIISILLIPFFLLSIRVYIISNFHHKKGNELYRKGKISESIEAYRRSGSQYLPWGGVSQNSLTKLEEISYEFQKNNPKISLKALFAIRRVIFSSKSLFTPRKNLLEKTNKRIVALSLSNKSLKFKIDGKLQKKALFKQLSQNRGTNNFLAFISSIFLFLWILSVIMFIFRGLTIKLKLIPQKASFWGGISLFSLFFWMVCLRFS
jgi:hypothetical protein